MTFNLVDDCIYCVLKHLQDYRSTLFNCLFVNRFWCKATVPLLYADPFGKVTNKTHSSIISTLILCSNETEILRLKNKLNPVIAKVNINCERKPLFEYPKYLEIFNYYEIDAAIFQWSMNELFSHDISIKHFVYQLILRQCNNIKHINILFDENYDFQTFTLNLTKLASLTLYCDNELQLSFLNSNICLNLKKLKIILNNNNNNNNNNTIKEKLCTIVQKQNNLKEIILVANSQNFLNDIFLSLEFQKNSLVFIEFNRISFSKISFKNFINLFNLKYLKFDNCGEISLETCEILKYASFKLKKLEFRWTVSSGGIIEPLIIKYLGASLQELTIDISNNSIIENILLYCLNLITLEIKTGPDTNLSVFSYFKDLRIRILKINDHCYSNDVELFKNLSSNLPISVKEISLIFSQPSRLTNYSYFKEFLENFHDYLEILYLEIIVFDFAYFLKTILNYIERNNSNNSLKILNIKKSEKSNEEELKLLDQIRSKRVKINIQEIDYDAIFGFFS